MEGLFKSKPKTQKNSDEVVRLTRNLLVSLLSNEHDFHKRDEKVFTCVCTYTYTYIYSHEHEHHLKFSKKCTYR